MPSARAQVTDTTPPVIQSISFSPGQVDVSTGAQTITLTVRVTDAQSGFKAGGIAFDSPTGNIISIGYGPLQRISGDDKDGVYRFPATFAQGIESGQWHVGSASALDVANNPILLFNPPTSPSALTILSQFNAADFTVSEGDVRATATVIRRGDTSAAATVNYSTADTDTYTFGCADTTNNHGAAYARCDFATAVGTLSFAPSETSKTLTVPLIDDAHVEGPETFQIILTNPAGARVGSTTVTIQDNDVAGQPNPVFSSPFFVRQQYLDFLSREPDDDGFNAWLGVLNRCPDVNNTDPNSPSAACDRILVSQSFFGSPEFQLKGYFVYRFYKLAFNRLPAYPEIVVDMSAVTGTTPADTLARKAAFTGSFAQRQEFIAAYGGQANADFVATLMNRYNLRQVTTPDPANPDSTTKVTLTSSDLTNRLNVGTLTKAQVLRAIADSDEVFQLEYNRAFVAAEYYGYLRRTPEAAGYQVWLDYLTQHPTDARTMVNGFVNSTEYRLRFGAPTP